jgi:hypothetical protein
MDVGGEFLTDRADWIEEQEVSAELAVFAIPRSLLLAYPS